MSEARDPSTAPLRPSKTGAAAIYLIFIALVARTLLHEAIRPELPRYIGLEILFAVLYSALFWRPKRPAWQLHLYFVVQIGLVLGILSLRPQFDFVVVLFAMLTYQAALFFTGRTRWLWVAAFVGLTGGSLIYYLDLVRGLALALTTMAAEIIISSFVIVNQDLEQARADSERLLGELRDTHQQLEAYAGQVEQMAAIQERNRLARELHDSVSQLIFSISLTARSAQLLLESDPGRVPELLNHLTEMTGDALGRLRSLITRLHPKA